MKISDYLPENHIITDLKGTRKIEIIEELLGLMDQLKLVNDYDLALSDILAREGYLSTGLENGLAIPHAKSRGISTLAMVFGIKKEGVEFETLDGKPANLIFLVLSPLDTSGPHIQALAMISRNLKNAVVRDQLLKSQTPNNVAEIFKSFS
jgi:mannitol/fructose-specific phosphotransferase system IIA component (Ntr-type)